MEPLKLDLDISILQKQPNLDCNVILEIEPLAPLSMVSELPGSYYKTLKIPDKKMLCGLFENLLGWHIDLADRKAILKEIKQLRDKWIKQQKKKHNTFFNTAAIPFTDYSKGSTYMPLLMDYFEIQNVQPDISRVIFYDDLWSKAYRRADAVNHPKGTFNISYELLADKRNLKRSEKNANQVDDKALETFFKENITKYPLYYSTPASREYVAMDGKFITFINMDSELYAMLTEKVISENLCYLGNSEGWVDLKFKKQ
jgi:CRISPR-associated protein Cas5